MSDSALVAAARAAREMAYAPYSRFPVGAAVQTADGRVFTGANVENAAYGLAQCAERVAVAQAVLSGSTRLAAVAIIADSPHPVAPCGACRQVLAEFAAGDLRIIMANVAGQLRVATLGELLPGAFGAGDLPSSPAP